MYELLRDHLTEHWTTYFPGDPKPVSVQLLLTKGSLGNAGGRVTFFVFADHKADPRAVVKISRDPAATRLIDAEHDALRYVHAHAPRAAAGRAPRAIHRGELGSYAFILQDAMNGSSASALITERLSGGAGRAYDIITAAADWLASLQREIAEKQPAPFLSAADLTGLIAGYQERYHPAPGSRPANLLVTMAGMIPGLTQHAYPLFSVHGDFSAINIILNRAELSVIDWEEARPAGLPLYDLFFLLTFFEFGPAASRAEGDTRIRTYHDVFTDGGRHAAYAASVIKRYGAACGIDTDHVCALYGFFLLSRALREYDVLAAQAARGFVPIVKPYGSTARYADGSLFRENVYAALLSAYAETRNRFILNPIL